MMALPAWRVERMLRSDGRIGWHELWQRNRSPEATASTQQAPTWRLTRLGTVGLLLQVPQFNPFKKPSEDYFEGGPTTLNLRFREIWRRQLPCMLTCNASIRSLGKSGDPKEVTVYLGQLARGGPRAVLQAGHHDLSKFAMGHVNWPGVGKPSAGARRSERHP